MKKDKKRKVLHNLNVTDYLVIICIGSIIGFTAFVMYQYYYKGIPVIDLKTEVFAFFGVELMAMATIAVSDNFARRSRKEEMEMYKEEEEEC